MKTKIIFSAIILFSLSTIVLLSFRFTGVVHVLELGQTVALTDVKGRIDHMAFDSEGQRIFICALGNNSVEVVDAKNNVFLKSIKNIKEPQGIVFVSDLKKLFVSSAGDGYLRAFEAQNYSLVDSIFIGNDADNVRFDSEKQKMYVGSDLGMAIIDVKTFTLDKMIELEGHPESFQIDNSARRMFVNVPDAHEIEVINMKSNTVVEKWALTDSKDNFPMCVDEATHRLFIVCRHPGKILVMNDDDGSILTAIPCAGDADDIYFDGNSRQLYVSCGEGFVDAFIENGKNSFSESEHIASRFLARTSLLIASEKKYFLAVPAELGKDAELRIYNIKN